MRFGEPCLAVSVDPAKLPRYSVIRAPIPLRTGGIDDKRLVVLGHHAGTVVCVKTTTDKQAFYAARPELLPGCVIYEAGEVPEFEQRTIIEFQRESLFEVEHRKLVRLFAQDHSRILGALPADTHGKFIAAIQAAPRLDTYDRQYLGPILGVRF